MLKTIKINNTDLNLKILTDADESVFNEIFTDRDYKILDPIIKNAKNLILDIGAHLGFFSIYTKTLNSYVPIIAFEPDERNFDLLKENLKLNHIKNITVKRVAVSNVIQKQALYISPDSHNHSLLQSANVEQNNTKVIDTTTIDKILAWTPVCDLVKMDCEGAEFEIIKNLPPETFLKIKTFYVEYHEFGDNLKKENLSEIFRKNNFNVKIFYSHYDKKMGFILAVK